MILKKRNLYKFAEEPEGTQESKGIFKLPSKETTRKFLTTGVSAAVGGFFEALRRRKNAEGLKGRLFYNVVGPGLTSAFIAGGSQLLRDQKGIKSFIRDYFTSFTSSMASGLLTKLLLNFAAKKK